MRTLYMNMVGTEQRIALEEEGKIVEFFFRRPDDDEIVGNLYQARVTRVLPGMQAAFIDIGMDKQAYLHRDDIAAGNGQPISQLVHQGQALLVQVIKNAVDQKGPKLTTKIELTGMYAVYMTTDPMVAISRNIEEASKRNELQELGTKLGGGFIFRTACKESSLSTIRMEIEKLKEIYGSIMRYKGNIPALVHSSQSFLDRVLKQIPSHTISTIYVDDSSVYKEVIRQVGKEKVILYNDKQSLFDYFHIEQQVEQAIKKVVWLENGAYLLIEQMETMTVIDVNTGKYTGKVEQTDTILQTNLHAATEIARQLRIRDIGGMIAIDFINMKEETSKEQVKRALIAALKKDSTTTRVFSFTALGILEMTRKRKKKSLRDYILAPCICCNNGFALAPSAAAYQLQRELLQYKDSDYEAVLVEASSDLQEQFRKLQLNQVLSVEVSFVTNEVHTYQVRLFGTKSEVAKRKNK